MKRSSKLISTTFLIASLLHGSIFAAELSVSKVAVKENAGAPFAVSLSASSSDIVREGNLTLSLDNGSFDTKELKAKIGAQDISKKVTVLENVIVLNIGKDEMTAISKGDKIVVNGIANTKGLGEKNLTVDAESIGLGKETKVFANVTNVDPSFVKLVGSSVNSVGYEKHSVLSGFIVTPKSGEVTMTLPYGVEWNSSAMEKKENLSGAKIVELKGRKLVAKLDGGSSFTVKPVVNINEDTPKGEIELTVETATDKTNIVVGKLEEYNVSIDVLNGVKQAYKGVNNIEVVVELKSKGGRLPETSYVDFKVVGGKVTGEAIKAKETGSSAKITKPTDKFAFRTVDNGDSMRLVLNVFPDREASEVLLEAKLRNADAKATMVKLDDRASVSSEKKTIKGGTLSESVGNIVINESATKALGSGDVYGVLVESDKFGQVLFGNDSKIDSKGVLVRNLGLSKDERVLYFTVNRGSSGSDKGVVTLSDLKISTQRTVAKGNYKGTFFRAVKPSKELRNFTTSDGQEYGIEPVTTFDFFTIGEEPAPAPTPVPTPEPAPQPIPDIKQTKTIFKLGSSKYLDGEVEKQLTSPVYTKSGYTMLPMRVIAETLGVDVKWDNSTKIATFTKGDVVVKVKSNGTTLNRNGKDIKMNTPSENVKGSLFLPLSSLGDAFGLERGTGYVWVPETKQVIVIH